MRMQQIDRRVYPAGQVQFITLGSMKGMVGHSRFFKEMGKSDRRCAAISVGQPGIYSIKSYDKE